MAKIKVKQLFTFLCADLKNLIRFNVIAEEKGNSYPVFSANKKKELDEYLIKYMSDAGNHEINDVADLMEYVLIFCHELAHCLNKHSVYKPQDNAEYSAMEAHADFLAGRMATAFYTYGYNLRRIIETDYKYDKKIQRDKTAYCKLMAKAISKAYFDFYKGNEDPRYPHPTERVGLHIAGISSFFYRSPQFQTKRGEYVMINLVVTLNLDSSIHQDMSEAKVLDKADSKFLKHVLDVHLKIQGDQQQINDIKSPPLQDIFGTQYINNENIRRMHKEHMKNEVLNFAREKGLTDLINEEVFEEI
ncbi:TPA: hypothetical protein JI284_19225 [Acinetobacter baumannii]|uniref:hypothetical protein n=1 Tax=Acinetobacter baumannii TaxID=470 RepID=UPI0013BADFE4|nr:hypothetical protein [Acinetobacter baumannii]NDW71141.1 hypothetical protein [Acinetobacter baumannii]NHO91704.1 hypothetical protein [Acinetobacter baumannii]HAV6046970.1 hypothetical protein [Acinetobacter baumannii]HAV6055243.1 hypothetical protein [Acinetobacter baumannii]HAV6089731.1 hypothetical protein [Acinetobacter baumannii]